MVILKIFNVDTNENGTPLCTFQIGEHVVGRGSFSNCIDKKISRRHIIMNVKENEATLTLVHVTPIFYISSRTPNMQMIKKDESIRLSNGDKFAFLIDIWYTIRIEENENRADNIAGCSASTILRSDYQSSNATIATIDINPKSSKRSAEESYSEERKKLKLLNESLERLKNNIDQIVEQDNHNDGHQETVNVNEERSDENTTEVYKKENISDSDDDSDSHMLPEVTCDTEVITVVPVKSEHNSESDNEKDEKKNSETMDYTHRNDEETTLRIEPQVKKEPTSDIQNQNEGNEETDSLKNDHGTVTKTEEDNQNNGDTEENQVDASASSSGASMGNTVRREQCWYGQNCYRKNANHKSQFSHPGDSDYDDNSNDSRSPCPYGAQCYRTNPQHRKDFSHPNSRPAPKPSTSDRRNRRTNRGNMNNDSDSQDEHDPFSADEISSGSEVFEGDTDSDYMEDPDFEDMEDSEEMKIMFKEANKFLRKKRKD